MCRRECGRQRLTTEKAGPRFVNVVLADAECPVDRQADSAKQRREHAKKLRKCVDHGDDRKVRNLVNEGGVVDNVGQCSVVVVRKKELVYNYRADYRGQRCREAQRTAAC